MSSASNFIGDSANRPSRSPTWTKLDESLWWGHVVISKWEASIIHTAAQKEKKVDLCQRRCWKGSGLKWYLRITVNWPLHITGLSLQEAAFTRVHSESTSESSLILWNAGWLYTSFGHSDDDAFLISGSLLTRTALLLFSLAWKSYLHKGKLYKKDSNATNPKWLKYWIFQS